MKHLVEAILVVSACLLASCTRRVTPLPSQNSNQVTGAHSNRSDDINWDKGDKENEESLRNPPLSDWPFPNFETGPGRPLPNYVNFYAIDDRFPSYLLCEYAVKEENYDRAKESGYFRDALDQLRQSGPAKFPQITWVAVCIRNVEEHVDASTFEQSFKVGAIFRAVDVFDHSNDPWKLVANSEMDRHPFKYDLQQSTPGEQQRWLIVERHAATNRPPMESH